MKSESDSGRLAIARIVRTALESQMPPWDQKDLVLVLAQRGFAATTDQISYLMRAKHAPSPYLLQAIARLGICKDPSGKPYTTDDLLDIAAGRLQVTDTSSARDLILAEMQQQGMDLAAFAKHVKLSQAKLKLLLGEPSGEIIEPTDITRLCLKVATPTGKTGDWQWWADAIGIKKGTPQSASEIEKPNGASNGSATQGTHNPC